MNLLLEGHDKLRLLLKEDCSKIFFYHLLSFPAQQHDIVAIRDFKRLPYLNQEQV